MLFVFISSLYSRSRTQNFRARSKEIFHFWLEYVSILAQSFLVYQGDYFVALRQWRCCYSLTVNVFTFVDVGVQSNSES